MIGMLVGDEDAVEVADAAAQRFQPAQQFFLAQPRVDQQRGVIRLQQRAVAGTTRRENCDAERDALDLWDSIEPPHMGPNVAMIASCCTYVNRNPRPPDNYSARAAARPSPAGHGQR